MERKSYADEIREQEVLSNFTSQNVLAYIGDFAEHLFNHEGDGANYDTWDNWHNLYRWVCTECGEEADDEIDVCLDCGQALELEHRQVYGYYIVTPYFGRLLKQAGEPVFERYHGWIWGRMTCGQAIRLDGIIREICIKEKLINEEKENDIGI